MYRLGAAPTPQKVRPISFVLSEGGSVRGSVTLPIRPEDLNRIESSRVTVHQTLGRGPVGWVDNFGEGLPSVTISGNTGWRVAAGTGKDGFGSFEDLNKLVQRDYHAAKQDAIDAGQDPSRVQLLFVDALDNFAWSVVPTQFILRRSKSRPLLFQYQIALQAVSTDVAQPQRSAPAPVSQLSAVSGLSGASSDVSQSFTNLRSVDISSSSFTEFISTSTSIFNLVQTRGVTESLSSGVVQLASDLARVGTSAFRSLASGAGSAAGSMNRKAALIDVASAFSQAARWIGELTPQSTYENYSPLYAGTDKNIATLMLPSSTPADLSSDAVAAMAAVKHADPVLSPLSDAEIADHLAKIAKGVRV